MFSQGDIVKVDLNPIKGHEQGNYRPVLVLNTIPMPGGLSIVAPITTKDKSYPLEVVLDSRTQTRGCVLCFQLRTVDLRARDGKFVEHIPEDLLNECIDYCQRLFS